MTANELKYSFLLKFDALFEYSAPNYDDNQISKLLTQAQNRVFLDIYCNSDGSPKSGFESSEKVRKDLDQLIKQESWVTGGTGALKQSASQVGIHPNGIFFDMPTDYIYAIEETAKLTGGTEEAIVKPMRHDLYISNIKNPYKKPCSWLVWRMDFSSVTDPIGTTAGSVKRVELIHDGTGLIAYRLRYLRFPPEIIVDEYTPVNQRHCMLNAIGVHDAIVSEAVKIAKAATNPQEYQISAAEAASSKK